MESVPDDKPRRCPFRNPPVAAASRWSESTAFYGNRRSSTVARSGFPSDGRGISLSPGRFRRGLDRFSTQAAADADLAEAPNKKGDMTDAVNLTHAELEAQTVEEVPERELMGSLIKVGPVAPGGVRVRL